MNISIKLRYGENPHQTAIWRKNSHSMLINHPELSLNDLKNINVGYSLLRYINTPSTVIIKHVNIVGMALGNSFFTRLQLALDTDPRAALNGIIMFNHTLSAEELKAIEKYSFDAVVAPSFESYDTNLRLVTIRSPKEMLLDKLEHINLIDGTTIIQDQFHSKIKKITDFECNDLKIINPLIELDILIAWYISCSIKTNCAVLVRDGCTLAVAAGHQDGITAIEHAIYKAKHHCRHSQTLENAILAVDGNFPHEIPISQISNEKISIFILPGNASNDNEIKKTFLNRNCSVLFSKERCFQH